MACPHCGVDVAPGRGSCAGCGRPAAIHSVEGTARDLRALLRIRLVQVALGALLVYTLLSGEPVVILASIGLAFVMRRFAQRLDEPLTSFWPIRDSIPRKLRMFLAIVLPLIVGLLIIVTPLNRLLSWLPLVGPNASVFIMMTGISTCIAYILIREPVLQRP
jgi:hypothetical protein